MRYIKRLLIMLALCAATLVAAESPTIEFAPHSERFSLSTTLAVISAINRLGSEDYKVRESAFQSLKDIGGRARKFLVVGARSPDAETSQRCRELLREIDHAALLLKAVFDLRSENYQVRDAAFLLLKKEGPAARAAIAVGIHSYDV
jgi:hypothetical protein